MLLLYFDFGDFKSKMQWNATDINNKCIYPWIIGICHWTGLLWYNRRSFEIRVFQMRTRRGWCCPADQTHVEILVDKHISQTCRTTLWCMKRDSSKLGFSDIFFIFLKYIHSTAGKKNIQSDVCCLISYFYILFLCIIFKSILWRQSCLLYFRIQVIFYISYEGHGDPFPIHVRVATAVRHVAVLRDAWVASTVVAVYISALTSIYAVPSKKQQQQLCLHMLAWKTGGTWILTDFHIWHLPHLIIFEFENNFHFGSRKKKIKISRTFSFFRVVVVVASLSSVDVDLLSINNTKKKSQLYIPKKIKLGSIKN